VDKGLVLADPEYKYAWPTEDGVTQPTDVVDAEPCPAGELGTSTGT
jgi:hypothetical protein